MPRFRVKAGESIAMGNKDLKGGDEFEAPEGEAKIWRNIPKVEEVLDLQVKRGRYNRRDMRAEEEQ